MRKRRENHEPTGSGKLREPEGTGSPGESVPLRKRRKAGGVEAGSEPSAQMPIQLSGVAVGKFHEMGTGWSSGLTGAGMEKAWEGEAALKTHVEAEMLPLRVSV